MPKKASKGPKSSEHPTTWPNLTNEVEVGNLKKIRVDPDDLRISVDGHDQPKIYEIRDNTLKVLMHPSVLELHAVRVVWTPHGNERQMHLRVWVRCGRREVVADVLVDTRAKVSLERKGLFPDKCLKDSDRPVRLNVANGEIMGERSCQAELGLEYTEHDRLDRPDQAKRLMLQGKFYEADLPD